jgi:hypothetical protein
MKTLVFPVILISLFLLLTASFYSLDSEVKITSDIACTNEMVCQVVTDTTNKDKRLILETTNKTILYPVLESNNLILVENSNVRICYSNIDSTNSTHKTIFINKVVFLP